MLLYLPTVHAQEIEVIKVVGSNVTVSDADPAEEFSVLESIMPEAVFIPGGIGGFLGFTERGTQTIHTTVYRNGVPSNDAGSGWYDFGHDIATGSERVVSVSGPNGVLYGSGSLGGTVFINDTFKSGVVTRVGEKHALTSATLASENHGINFTYMAVNNGSVKTSNEEEDLYKNGTLRTVHNFNNFTVSTNFTDYTYDYDECFDSQWQMSNSCEQKGTKAGISIRNENITLGYSYNKSEYFTEDEQTWESEADRIYFDARENFAITDSVDAIVGLTVDRETYADASKNNHAVYSVINLNNSSSFGVRVTEDAAVYRFGYQNEDFAFSVGSSYRNPTLYETMGDSYVNANSELEPEESIGYEVSYKSFTAFYYDFSEGIDYDFSNNQFVNTGEYVSQGVRYVEDFDNFGVFLGYTDSDIARVPKYKASISYAYEWQEYTTKLVYTGMFDRGIDTTGLPIDDIKTVDFIVSTQMFNSVRTTLMVSDLLNRRFEVTPGYGAGGREVFLTFSVDF